MAIADKQFGKKQNTNGAGAKHEIQFSSDIRLAHLFPMHLFSTPLETSQNLTVFCCFQGVEKRFIGNKWIKTSRLKVPKSNNVFSVGIARFSKVFILMGRC